MRTFTRSLFVLLIVALAVGNAVFPGRGTHIQAAR